MYAILDAIAGVLHGMNGVHLVIALAIIVVAYVKVGNRE